MEQNKATLSKEERIAERLARVELQRQKQKENSGDKSIDDKYGNDANLANQTKQQIKKSRDFLDESKESVLKCVSDIKLDAQIIENKRRCDYVNETDQRLYLLEESIKNGNVKNSQIDEKWNQLMDVTIAQELYVGIQNTKEECNDLIECYQNVGKSFLKKYQKKSEDYVLLLKQQESDIANMIWHMHDSIEKLKQMYENELTEIEKSFMKERKEEIIEKNEKKFDQLLKDTRKQEFLILEDEISLNKKFSNDLEKVRREDSESFNKLKINLENHIQLLEQQLQDMQSLYQLNNEKLNYNFQILKEREKENLMTLDHLKRREKKLKNLLLNHKSKFEKSNDSYKIENKLLTNEYQRITTQYKNLQNKFKHFQICDSKKYDDILSMNQKQACNILTKVIKADQIISTQILGIKWDKQSWLDSIENNIILLSDSAGNNNDENDSNNNNENNNDNGNENNKNKSGQFDSTTDINGKSNKKPNNNNSNIKKKTDSLASDLINAVNDPTVTRFGSKTMANNNDSNKKNEKNKTDENDKNNEKNVKNNGIDNDENNMEKNGNENENEKNSKNNSIFALNKKYSKEEIYNVIEMLLKEAPFLIDHKMKSNLSNLNLTKDAQMLYEADSVLKALNIEDIDDFEELMSMFIRKSENNNNNHNNSKRHKKDYENENNIANTIEAYQTISILKKYLMHRDSSKSSQPAMMAAMMGNMKNMSMIQEKQLKRQKKDSQYWENLTQLFGNDKKILWQSLDKYLNKYTNILQQREKEAQSILRLKQENGQLKALLNQYLSQNQESTNNLIIPPQLITKM